MDIGNLVEVSPALTSLSGGNDGQSNQGESNVGAGTAEAVTTRWCPPRGLEAASFSVFNLITCATLYINLAYLYYINLSVIEEELYEKE